MTRQALAVACLLGVAGCQSPVIDRVTVEASARRIEPRVVRDCRVVEVAGAVATVVAIAIPGAGIIDVVVNRACDDPAMTARAIAVGEDLARRLRDQR